MGQAALNGAARFLFLGNHLALDFLNTHPVLNGQPAELIPDFKALLRWFRAAKLIRPRDVARLRRHWAESACARRTVEAMRELREKLRKEFLAWEHGGAVHPSTVAELNRLMARPSHAHQAECKWNHVGDGVVVRTAPPRRLVCSAGVCHGVVVR